MSLLDALILLCAASAALTAWMAPRHAPTTLHHLLDAAMVSICVAQVLTEGFYWQLVPAYVLAGLGVGSRRLSARRTRGVRIVTASATAVTMLLLAASWVFLPVPRLPMPTGPYPVGTAVFRWVLPHVPETTTSDPDDRRNIIVQAWYPARASASGAHAPYMDGLGHLPPRVAGVPRAVFARYDRIDTHAIAAAGVSADVMQWPVVIFSPGYGASRSFYSALLGDLASRGVIVLAVDHPYEAAMTQLADGRLVTQIERFVPGAPDRIGYMIQQTERRVADLRAVLDGVVLSTPFGMLASRMDQTRIIVAGHSFGGAAALATALVDDRVRASVNIDGTLYGTLPDQMHTKPFLLVESDRAETRHGALFIDGQARLFAHPGARGQRNQLLRANHYSFTDAPLLLSAPWRWAASLFLGGSRGTPETVRITNDYLIGFMATTIPEKT